MILLYCIGTTVFNYEELTKGEGWGMVGMIGLGGIGLALFLIDLIVQKAFRSKTAMFITATLVVILAILLFFS